MIKNLIKALAVIAIVGNVILATPGVANADDRPVVATYKDKEKHKNLVRLYEDSVQLVDTNQKTTLYTDSWRKNVMRVSPTTFT